LPAKRQGIVETAIVAIQRDALLAFDEGEADAELDAMSFSGFFEREVRS
jgi:hypothetical protein